jgi:hypothetical protein
MRAQHGHDSLWYSNRLIRDAAFQISQRLRGVMSGLRNDLHSVVLVLRQGGEGKTSNACRQEQEQLASCALVQKKSSVTPIRNVDVCDTHFLESLRRLLRADQNGLPCGESLVSGV